MTEAAVVEANPGSSHSPLVSLSFQKNEQRKLKYLEGEPKILGITQICMCIFQSSCLGMLYANMLSRIDLEIPFIISSLLILIAGSVAVAAKNLHMPTVKACMGMEIVAGVAALFNLIVCIIKMNDFPFYCYHYLYSNDTHEIGKSCQKSEAAHMHLFAELIVFQVALIAISFTLVAYTCKVVNCCSPAPKELVISIQGPPAPL